MCILSSPLPDVAAALEPTPARLLNPTTRQQLALDALAGQPITTLADQHHVSRKFVYQQLHHAHDALDQAFNPPDIDPPQLLFWLPVTKSWLRQLVLGLTLLCHSSLRGVQELLTDLFDYSLSLGTVHNILHQAVATARRLNSQQDLTAVRIGAHDEIFQAGRPVLVGADVASTYCYLLSVAEHRDADTWGVRLLELTERGFHPDATIADFAGGLRAGQAEALPDVPCRGDVFHALQTATQLVRYVDNRGYDAIATRSRLEQRQARSEHRQGRKDLSLAAQLRYARETEMQALTLADEVSALIAWLRQDILAVSGLDYANRCALYDWIVAELRRRESLCPQKIRPVRCLLEKQRDDLLAFAKQLDQDVLALAESYEVPVAMVEETRQLLSMPSGQPEGLAHSDPQLLSVHVHVSWRGDAQPNRVASDREDRDGEFAVRHDNAFADFATEDEHRFSSVNKDSSPVLARPLRRRSSKTPPRFLSDLPFGIGVHDGTESPGGADARQPQTAEDRYHNQEHGSQQHQLGVHDVPHSKCVLTHQKCKKTNPLTTPAFSHGSSA